MSDIVLNQIDKTLNFFVFNFLELSILFLFVSLLVEIINILLDPKKVQKILSSSKGGFFIASAMGSLTPFCSCSSIPFTLGLLKAKASFGPIMTFLFTSPLLNPIIVAVFWSAFGFEVTIVYALISLSVSILAGYTLEKLGFEKYVKKEMFENNVHLASCALNTSKSTNFSSSDFSKSSSFQAKKPSLETSCCDTPKIKLEKTKLEQIKNKELLVRTWKQFLSFVPYIAIGIAIGAIVHGFVPQEILSKYAGEQNPYAVPFSALIGIPLYIRASSMVGIAPALIDNGMSMGSILALTVAGAGASLPEMIMLKKIFKLPIMAFFILIVFTMAITCGYIVNWYFT